MGYSRYNYRTEESNTMPKLIQIKGRGQTVSFPDEMPDEEIQSVLRQNFPPSVPQTEDASLLSSAGRGIGQGLIGATGVGIGNLARIAAREEGSDLDIIGQNIVGATKEFTQRFAPRPDEIDFQPGDPNWWAYNIGSAGGSFIPTVGITVLASLAGTPLLGAAAAGGIVGGMLEAGGLYEEALAAGRSKSVRDFQAIQMGAGSMVLNTAGLGGIARLGGAGLFARAINVALAGVVEGVTEALEEPLSETIQGTPWTTGTIRRMMAVGFPSAVVGGGASTIRNLHDYYLSDEAAARRDLKKAGVDVPEDVTGPTLAILAADQIVLRLKSKGEIPEGLMTFREKHDLVAPSIKLAPKGIIDVGLEGVATITEGRRPLFDAEGNPIQLIARPATILSRLKLRGKPVNRHDLPYLQQVLVERQTAKRRPVFTEKTDMEFLLQEHGIEIEEAEAGFTQQERDSLARTFGGGQITEASSTKALLNELMLQNSLEGTGSSVRQVMDEAFAGTIFGGVPSVKGKARKAPFGPTLQSPTLLSIVQNIKAERISPEVLAATAKRVGSEQELTTTNVLKFMEDKPAAKKDVIAYLESILETAGGEFGAITGQMLRTKGRVQISPGLSAAPKQLTYLLRGFQAQDFSTGLHEWAHFLSHVATGDMQALIEKGVKAPVESWDTKKSEDFAKGFELYLMEGNIPKGQEHRLNHVYAWLADEMRQVYRTQRPQLSSTMSEEVKLAYDIMLRGWEPSDRAVGVNAEALVEAEFAADLSQTEQDVLNQKIGRDDPRLGQTAPIEGPFENLEHFPGIDLVGTAAARVDAKASDDAIVRAQGELEKLGYTLLFGKRPSQKGELKGTLPGGRIIPIPAGTPMVTARIMDKSGKVVGLATNRDVGGTVSVGDVRGADIVDSDIALWLMDQALAQAAQQDSRFELIRRNTTTLVLNQIAGGGEQFTPTTEQGWMESGEGILDNPANVEELLKRKVLTDTEAAALANLRLELLGGTGAPNEELIARYASWPSLEQEILTVIKNRSSLAGQSLRQARYFKAREDAVMLAQSMGLDLSDPLSQSILQAGGNELEQFNRFLSIKDKPTEIGPRILIAAMYESMLSNPATQIINMTGNLLWQPYLIGDRALTGLIDKAWSSITGKSRQRYATEAMILFRSYVSRDTHGIAGKILREKFTSRDINLESMTAVEDDMGAVDFNLFPLLAKFAKNPSKAKTELAFLFTTPTRTMAAVDMYFKALASRSQKEAIMHRFSRVEGTERVNRKTEYIQKLLRGKPRVAADGSATFSEANIRMSNAMFEELVKGVRVTKTSVSGTESTEPATRHNLHRMTEVDIRKQLDQYLNLAVENDAAMFAEHATFQDEFGEFMKAIRDLRTKPFKGLGRAFMPFIKTSTNLAKRGLEMTPGLGIAISRTGPRPLIFAEMAAKQMEGAFITFMLWTLMEKGLLTGPPPREKNKREAFYRAGMIPEAFKIGNTWVSYRRIEPFAFALSLQADLYTKFIGEEKGSSKVDIFSQAVHTSVQHIIDNTFMRSLVASVKEERSLSKQAGWIAGGFVPYSALWRGFDNEYQAATAGEVIIRENRTFMDTFGNSLPPGIKEAVGYGQEPRRDVFGKVITRPSNWFTEWTPVRYQNRQPDKTEQVLQAIGYYPGFPDRKILIGKEQVELPDDLYKEYLVASGQRAKRVFDNMTRSVTISQGNKVSIRRNLERVFNKIRAQERGKVRRLMRDRIKAEQGNGGL